MIDTQDFVEILTEVFGDFERHAEELRKLDSVIGDGDLGVTVELGSRALKSYLENPDADNIGQLLGKCGMQFNKASPSTFGTLLASALISAGKAVPGKQEIDAEGLVLMADGAVDGIKKRGKAEPGDKTMLDCLVPAVEAFENKLNDGAQTKEALNAAVKAAEEGMKATIPMMSKHGRAVWHREKTVGVQDAGATAMYYLVESFARHVSSRI